MPEGLLYVMAGAVIVSALALVLQLLILYGLYTSSKKLNAEVVSLLPGIRQLISSAESTLAVSRTQLTVLTAQVTEFTAKASDVLVQTGVQLHKVDNSLTDILVRLGVQLERAEMMVDDSLTKVHSTVIGIHDGVMRPLREISGVSAGIRAAIQTLTRGNRPNVTEATHDDEMFI
ncbi:MAG: hypothetical protein ABI693_18175 [Bryobacteraceae bacterium]